MGTPIDREHFTAEERHRFEERLQHDLVALRMLVERPGFGEGEATIGIELEMHLVDSSGRPKPVNEAVRARANDHHVTLEINRFNLEIESLPLPLVGSPFAALEDELGARLSRVRAAASDEGACAVLVGTLPTLRIDDLGPGALSEGLRYHVLSRTLRAMRGAPFEVRIDGRESLRTQCDDVSLEGANTSLQVHLRVPPAQFARHYDAAQLGAGPLLAATGNSPFFDGRCLWEESRIALFKQAVDTRIELDEDWREPPRVGFGHGYVRHPTEPFMENVALHVPLFALVSDEDPIDVVRAGGVPRLDELRLHQGTVWTWNRAIYDPHDGGHLRIEHRVLPSGPTLADGMANAAFALGLTLGLAESIDGLVAAFPFQYAERNFYRGAKHGLDAEMLWPTRRAPSPRAVRARELVLELLPLAREGLVRAGVVPGEVDARLSLIRERVETGRTGSVVQRRLFARHDRERSRDDALAAMMREYMQHASSGEPVHRWPV